MNLSKFKAFNVIATAAVVGASLAGGVSGVSAATESQDVIYASEVKFASANALHGQPGKHWTTNNADGIKINTNPEGKPIKLKVNGKVQTFSKGLGAHAPSSITYDLTKQNFEKFTAYAGVDASSSSVGDARVKVYVDNKLVDQSGSLSPSSNAKYFEIDLKGKKTLKLVAESTDGFSDGDNAVWADAKFYKVATNAVTALKEIKPEDVHVRGTVSSDVTKVNIYLNEEKVRTRPVESDGTFYGHVSNNLKVDDVIKVVPINAEGVEGTPMEVTVAETYTNGPILTRAYYQDANYLRGTANSETAYIRVYVENEQGQLVHLRKRNIESDGTFYVYILDGVKEGSKVTVVPYDKYDRAGTAHTHTYSASLIKK